MFGSRETRPRDAEDKMRVVGLTGGIGSGKSTVAELLRAHGALGVDADVLARQVVAPGTPGLAEVVEAFGLDVLLPDGTLDREELGRRVFADPAARIRIEAITHPRIHAELLRRVERSRGSGAPLFVFEAALLVDRRGRAGRWGLDGLLWVSADPELRVRRVVARSGLAEEAVRARIAAQIPDAKGRGAADWVIRNEEDLEALEARVDVLWPVLIQGAAP